MRSLVSLTTVLMLAACSSGGGDAGGTEPAVSPCSSTGQKQFVLEAARDWYLWNNLLPANVNIDQYATPEALLDYLVSFQPLDNASRIEVAEADQRFFGEGKYEGFGFSSRFEAADDLRLTRVFTDSPANRAGLARGQRILELNGRSIAEIQAAEGVGAVLDTTPVEFTLRETDGSEFTVTVAKDVVTIDPVPQWRVIDAGAGRKVGYVELAQFISTADAVLDTVFADFNAQFVNDVIIDLRYNGGGLVATAELLGDYLGGLVHENLVFSKTLFNQDRAAANNSQEFFERRGNSMSLSKLVVIATRSTASASELVANSMDPYVVGGIGIVGDDTLGKPVGQSGFDFCEKRLRLTTFQTVNANDFGDYFDGLPADCAAPDDVSVPVGDAADPNLITALEYLDTGACPPTALLPGAAKPSPALAPRKADRRGPPWREFADAY